MSLRDNVDGGSAKHNHWMLWYSFWREMCCLFTRCASYARQGSVRYDHLWQVHSTRKDTTPGRHMAALLQQPCVLRSNAATHQRIVLNLHQNKNAMDLEKGRLNGQAVSRQPHKPSTKTMMRQTARLFVCVCFHSYQRQIGLE